MMHQRKGKKLTIYFLILLFVGSINNLNLNEIKFENIENIRVIGLNQDENLILEKNLKSLNLENIFFLNGKEINAVINKNSLIEKYEVIKKYPSTLQVKVQRTIFLAKINQNSKIFIIGSNGKLSNKNYTNKELPHVFGNPDIKDFLDLRQNIDDSKFAYKQIKNFFFFKSGRWDLELANNIVIKLPKNNILYSLNNAFNFLNTKLTKNIKVIDLRIKNQIITND